MVAGVFLATHPSVYTAIHESVAHCRRKQEVIEPHALVCSPPVALVIPERPERSVGVQPPESIGSALRQQSRERLPALRLDQCVVVQRSRLIDVLRRWYNVIIAGQYDGHTGRHEFAGVRD